jgi:hypothetical protein
MLELLLELYIAIYMHRDFMYNHLISFSTCLYLILNNSFTYSRYHALQMIALI